MKKAIVLFADSKIGMTTANALVDEGYDVACAGCGVCVGDALKQDVSWVKMDTNDVEATVKACIDQLNGVDLLVCCPPTAEWKMNKNFLLSEDSDIDGLIDTELLSYWIGARTAARYMVKRNIKGCVIFLVSIHADNAMPGDYLYGGINAALKHSCATIALDLAPYGIRTASVSYGAVAESTFDELVSEGMGSNEAEFVANFGDVLPLGRMCRPEEVSNAVLFLASDKAAYITGRDIMIDGGSFLFCMPEGPLNEGEVDAGWTHLRKINPQENW